MIHVKSLLFLLTIFVPFLSDCQLNLTTSPYTQNFNGLGSGLPTGWTCRTNANSTSLGTSQTFSTTKVNWNSTTAAYQNVASTNALTSTSNTSAQSASTDRALSIRPSGSFGDGGQAFTLQLANTNGFANFSLSMKHLILDAQGRTTVYTVQYTTAASGTSGWTNLGTFTTDVAWGETPATYSFGSALDNIGNAVWIRVLGSASTGSGSRDTYGIEDFELSFTSSSANTVSLSSSGAVGSEASASILTLTATATAAVTTDQTVDVAITGTGITGGDYSLGSTQITILSGQTAGSTTFSILDDADVEGTETALATLSNPSSEIILGFPSSVEIAITDNDFNPEVTLSASSTTGSEIGQTIITLTANATYAVTGNQTVDIAVSGTGITSGDYLLGATQITILSGNLTGTTTFTIVDDLLAEGAETAHIAISNPSSGLTLGSTLTEDILITDDDLVVYDLIINEILADPNSDANGDGVYNSGADEFVEIYNNENTSVDMSGYAISDAVQVRHVFPSGSVVPAKSFITIFGGGSSANIPGITQISSTSQLGLNNSSDVVTLTHPAGITIATYSYGSEAGNNVSIGRNPDFSGTFAAHNTIPVAGREYSPGLLNVLNGPEISPADCGSTITLIHYDYFHAEPVVGATEYEFRISNNSGVIDTVNTGVLDSARFSDFVGYHYDSTYAVDVRAKVGGVWSPFGASCNISIGSPSTSLQNQCGTTLPNIHSNIFAWFVPMMSPYYFEVSSAGTVIDTVSSPTRFFSLANLLGGAAYGTDYSIRVAVNNAGTITPFGSACLVSTPAIPSTQLRPSSCGTTVAYITSNIFANVLSGATNYRFKLTNSGNSQTFTTTSYFTSLANFSLTYGTTYDVEISAEIGGTFGPYGSVCTITTPAAPTSQLRASSCGVTVPYITSNIFANIVTGATNYKFRVTNNGNSQTFTTASYFTSLANFSLAYGTTYDVDISVEIGGTFGAYGSVCTVTTPAAPTSQLRASHCGVTVPYITSNIFANIVTGATNYRFRVTNNGNSQTYTTASYFTSLAHFNLTASTTYDVDISVEIAGAFGPYGSVCTITTPATPPVAPGMATIDESAHDAQSNMAYKSAVVENVKSQFDTKVYPNPFGEMVTVDFESDDNETPILLTVFDATGRIIETKEVHLPTETSIQFGENYVAGVYQIVVTQNQNNKTMRVVKR